MRHWLLLVFLFSFESPLHAQTQTLVPVVRQISSTTTPTVLKTYVKTEKYGDEPYVLLPQVATLFRGHLSWRTASEQVELRLRGQTFRFFYHSPLVLINGQRRLLDRQTVKNEEGFWVPARFFATDSFFHLTKTKLDWPDNPSPPKATVGVPSTVKPQQTKLMDPLPVAAGEDGKKNLTTTSRSEPPVTINRPYAIKRIVLDPGHGGKDPGAIGPKGTQEKDITLKLAQELADILREKEGYEVLMTRMDDTFVPLDERTRMANKHDADLFVSVHCNASVSSKLKGFEVYFLSETASDPRADAVARFENAPLALEGKKAPTPSRVQQVLRSLVKTANINESSEVGALVHQHLDKRLQTDALGVKQAAFYVLRGAEMPAVLIEVGFLSNAREEKSLQKADYRHKISQGIVEAIKTYDLRKQKDHP